MSVKILPTAAQQCRNNLYDKSRINRSNRVRGLQSTQRVINFVHAARSRSTVVGVIHKLDRRRVLFTAQSTCRGEIFYVQCLGRSSRGKYSYFWRYLNLLTTQFRIGQRQLRSSPALCCQSRFLFRISCLFYSCLLGLEFS